MRRPTGNQRFAKASASPPAGQKPRVLFVTWDGPQVSYLESLFIPIFAGLKEEGFAFDVLQFRWGGKASEDRARDACESHGIGYQSVRVRRWGGGAGPFLSALLGGRQVREAVRSFCSDVIMPRSLMPALATMSAGGTKLRPIVFDADGLESDERVDVVGLSPKGATYRILRDAEAQMVRQATAVLTRTAKAAEILKARAGPPVREDQFYVVANGRDETIFRPGSQASRAAVREELGVQAASPLLVYAGSVGPQYRFDAVARLFGEVRSIRKDARLLVLTGSPEAATTALGDAADGSIVKRLPPDQVPRFLSAADIGLAYRSTGFSMQGVAPIKVGEYLLCGLPVIGTAEVGDVRSIVEEGLFFDDGGNGSRSAARWLLDDVLSQRGAYRERARALGQAHFSLRRSIEKYALALSAFRI